ncbi:MAG: tetratricopeptide repeat protein [Cyanobacteria bacterium P01_A01_bin.83]
MQTEASDRLKQDKSICFYLGAIAPDLPEWVDREKEYNLLQTWLYNSDIYTVGIQGLGGSGKSSISGCLYRNTNFKYKFWVDFEQKAELDFAFFAERIIKELNGNITQSGNITLLVNDLLSILKEKRCLLVADNIETLLNDKRYWQEEGYKQFFGGWLKQKPNSTLLITTRDKPKSFNNISTWFNLQGMSIEEGVILLQRLNIKGSQSELKKFVEYVDGHPLTLKLVASYLNEYYNCQLDEIQKLKLNQFDLAFEKAEGEHRNVQNARLAWIIQQHFAKLSKKQKKFLIDLSIYRLPFDREAASYIWNSSEKNIAEVQHELKNIVHCSLILQTFNQKYQFQPLVKEYIYQQKENSDKAHQNAAKYYQNHFINSDLWCDLKDVLGYVEFIHHSCEIQNYELALSAFTRIYRFLESNGYSSTIIETCQKFLSIDSSQGKWILATILMYLGQTFRTTGKYQQSIECLNKAKNIYAELKDIESTFRINIPLGYSYIGMGQYETAISLFKECLSIPLITVETTVRCQEGIATVYSLVGDFLEAIKYYSKCLSFIEQIEDKEFASGIYGNLGSAYIDIGEYDRAIDCIGKHLKYAKNKKNLIHQRTALMNLGTAYSHIGKYEQAINYVRESIEISDNIQNLSSKSESLISLACLYVNTKQYNEAIKYSEESLKIARKFHNLPDQGLSLLNLGAAYGGQKKFEIAIEKLNDSLSIAKDIGNVKLEADCLFNKGIVLSESLKISESIAAYNNAKNLYKKMQLHQKAELCNFQINILNILISRE